MSNSTVEESPAQYGKTVASSPGEQRVILRGVSWETYEALLKETGDERKSRFTYDQGVLEIVSPLNRHEHFNRLFELLVDALAEARGLNAYSSGSVTCKRKDLQRGIEPDSCFYIENEPLVRGKEDIDLNVDPAPDLMIEVDVYNSSSNKLTVCQALGVPEHWRYDGTDVEIRVLKNGVYVESDESRAFPGISINAALKN